MSISFSKVNSAPDNADTVFIISSQKDVSKLPFGSKEKKYIKDEIVSGNERVLLSNLGVQNHIIVISSGKDKKAHDRLESARKAGANIANNLNAGKKKSVYIISTQDELTSPMAEGISLRSYQFLKYRKDKKEQSNSLKKVILVGGAKKEVDRLNAVVPSVYATRDLVNEPLSFLTAPRLGKEIKRLAKLNGFKAEVFGKKKIESLKMGGLLSVNLGSVDEPTFSILEWKPKGAKNKKPIVLVGKGVVYDTGGMSLKPTPNSMDMMKCDMAGAAMMIGTMAAISKAKLNVHVIALIPATDNRPGGNAYVPGDIVTMFDGTTVEVLNTDAEGRMLLADALSYAKRYKPELVFDAATLTGAAVRAIGSYASCVMGTADEKEFDKLEQSGFDTYERVARMPFWDEYGQEMKSDIADLKNLGGSAAGQISAGKFLEHFTDYPWIHIDIAGPAFITHDDSYRGKWGTGYGVRLLFDMLSKR